MFPRSILKLKFMTTTGNKMKILAAIIAVILWILGLILLVETGKAQDLNLVAIPGFRAVDDAQVLEIYDRASYYFRQVGITFRMTYMRRSNNPCEFFHNYVVQLQELECIKEDAKAQGYRRKKMITYYMLPPWIIVNEPYGPQTALIGGIAEKIGGKVAMGNATSVSLRDGVEGDSRIDHSAVIVFHETAHLMFAKHIDYTPNVMKSDANTHTSEYGGKLPVHWVTQRQVKRWYVKRRKL